MKKKLLLIACYYNIIAKNTKLKRNVNAACGYLFGDMSLTKTNIDRGKKNVWKQSIEIERKDSKYKFWHWTKVTENNWTDLAI